MMPFRRFLALALLVALAGCGHKTTAQTTSETTTGAGGPAGFASEASAQAHCPSDQVVWLNTKTHVYHEKGMLYYGHTKQGAYVCRKAANAAGDRETKNGT
jgi:hypothetical protein